MTDVAIETRQLSKRYGRVAALDGLSLRVDDGEVFGFLGPNGAGKTTTIRLLLGLIRPDGGDATILGRRVTAGEIRWRADVGYLPGELALWPTVSGAQTLAFLEGLTGRPATRRGELLDRLRFSAADLLRPVRTYSDGMKQKIGIVQALQCRPRLVLLDEPTKGLDPLVQRGFYDLVRDLAAEGTTVFFSSHVLPEVERVSTRVAMLRAGRLVSVGSVQDLQRHLPRRVTATFTGDVDGGSFAALGRITFASPRRVELLLDGARVPELVARVHALPLADLTIEAPSLEEAFLEQYR